MIGETNKNLKDAKIVLGIVFFSNLCGQLASAYKKSACLKCGYLISEVFAYIHHSKS